MSGSRLLRAPRSVRSLRSLRSVLRRCARGARGGRCARCGRVPDAVGCGGCRPPRRGCRCRPDSLRRPGALRAAVAAVRPGSATGRRRDRPGPPSGRRRGRPALACPRSARPGCRRHGCRCPGCRRRSASGCRGTSFRPDAVPSRLSRASLRLSLLSSPAVLALGVVARCRRRPRPAGRSSSRGRSDDSLARRRRLGSGLGAAGLRGADGVHELALAHAAGALDSEPGGQLLQLGQQHPAETARALLGSAARRIAACSGVGGGCVGGGGGRFRHVRSFPRPGPSVLVFREAVFR